MSARKSKRSSSGSSTKKAIIITVCIMLIAAIAVIQFYPATISASASVFAKKQNLIAHRGLSSVHPECTEDAYIAAGLAGYYGAECDIHTTADGVIVVMHDDDVDRTTDGTGAIEDMTYAELSRLSIDTGNGIENCKNKEILSFDAYLEICEDYSMIPYVELKKMDIQCLPLMFSLIKKHGFEKSAVLISFNEEYLKEARRLNSEMQMMFLSNALTEENVTMCKENNFGIDFDFFKMIKYMKPLKEAKKSGIELCAWTVDSPIVADFLHLFGCDNITTNRITP